MRRLFSLVLIVTLISPLWPVQAIGDDAPPDNPNRVDALLAEMSVAEKVGQLYVVSLFGRQLSEPAARMLTDYHPGGVTLFDFNTDFESAASITRLINDMQATATASGASVPLFIATDHEGGRVRRIVNDVTLFPDPLAFGAVQDPAIVQRMGRVTGDELAALGVNMNLAPVADLTTRGDMLNRTRVMNRRTFGDDPARVGQIAAAYSDGLRDAGVVSVVKHFPGHGGAADSHLDLPIIDIDGETARAGALRAFQEAAARDVPAMMMGHLYYPALAPGEEIPATLSPGMVGILRDDFGYDGLILTDAMDMGAITRRYDITDASLMALQAGVDVILFGPNTTWTTQRDTILATIAAVENGDLSQARLDASVRRVLQTKADYGLLEWSPQDPETTAERVDLAASQAALRSLYLHAATLLRDDAQRLPLPDSPRVAVSYPGSLERIYFACLADAPNVEYVAYHRNPINSDFNAIRQLGRQYDTVVIFVEDAHYNLGHRDLVRLLPPEKTVVVALGSPYDLENFPEVSGYLALYSNLIASQEAACQVLFGQAPAQGRAPVAIGPYPTGYGLDTRSLPREVGEPQ